jgi:WhiB family transcriptional regulator, redox-sensing transcriptional regulator
MHTEYISDIALTDLIGERWTPGLEAAPDAPERPADAAKVAFLEHISTIPVWHDRAACRGFDAEIFFREHGRSTAAKAVCARCTVRQECLEDALTNLELFGVWGGTTERERQRIRNARRLRAAGIDLGDEVAAPRR